MPTFLEMDSFYKGYGLVLLATLSLKGYSLKTENSPYPLKGFDLRYNIVSMNIFLAYLYDNKLNISDFRPIFRPHSLDT